MNQRRLRILIVLTHPVQYASPILRLLAQDPRIDSRVAYCSLQGVDGQVDPDFGMELRWDIPLLDGYRWDLIRNWSWAPRVGTFFGLLNLGIWRIIRRGSFNAIVLFTGYACATFWVGILVAKMSGVPVLFNTDAISLESLDGSHWKPALKKFLLPAIFRLADIVMIGSEAGRQFMSSLGIPDSRVVLTPFVVDDTWWRQRASEVDRGAVRRSWGIPENAHVALFCAKLQPWKRPHDVLRAFARANVEGSYLVLVGDGSQRSSLEAEGKDLGITERTRFLGFVNQSGLPSVYKAADLLVLPSGHDRCPVVVCEAMLCGCPVALSDEVRGRFDLVKDGETGFVYQCGNIDALAGVITSAFGDRCKLTELGRAALRRMDTWTTRENVEAIVSAVAKAHGIRR